MQDFSETKFTLTYTELYQFTQYVNEPISYT